MQFSAVIGNERIKSLLAETIRAGRVSHAQLFVSDEGVGALPMAIAYAQALLCPNRTPEGDACGECANCYKMNRLEHPDCNFIFPVNKSKKAKATGRSDDKPTSDQFVHLWRELIIKTGGYISEEQWYSCIGLENQQGNINKEEANEIVRKMSFKSVQGGYKIVIMWLPEKMNEAAANTLLKLIEEPAPGTLFIFVSEQPDRVIATIRSRTQITTLAPLPQKFIAEYLYNEGIENGARIAQAAGGSLSRALELSRNEFQSEDFERFAALMRKGYTMKYGELFEWAESMAGIGREAQKMFCENSLAILRDCYLTSLNLAEITFVNPQTEKFINAFSPYTNHLTIEHFIREFELLVSHIRQNGNAKIIFSDFALKISKIIKAAK